MKEISELNLPEDVRYTKDHEWIKVEGGTAKVGLDDYAQDQLSDIVFVELPQPGDTFSQGEVFANVESVKAVSECYMPVSGEVIAVNSGLEDDPGLINLSPYEKGWMIEVKPDDLSDVEALMDRAAVLITLEGDA